MRFLSKFRGVAIFIAFFLHQSFALANEDLSKAIQKKDIKKITRLLSEGADLNYKTDKGESMLTLGYKKGNAKVVALLVSLGANLHSTDTNGDTIAHIAAAKDDLKTLKIVENDKRLWVSKNSSGKIPIMLAIEKNKHKAFLYFIDDSDVWRTSDNDGNNLVHFLAVSRLLKKIPDSNKVKNYVNQKNSAGELPLWKALHAKNFANSELLVSYGALPDSESEKGLRPLEFALTKKAGALFSALLKAGARTDFTTSAGKPFLIFVIEKEQYPFANKLIESGANLNINDTQGNSLVVFIVKNSHYPVLSSVLQKGVSVHEKNNAGKPLILISHENLMKKYTRYRAATFRILLENGADANTRSSSGNGILSEHAERNNTTEISLLLAHKANVRLADSKKNNALHFAASAGKISSFKLLHSAMGEIDVKGENNFTPLMFASRNGHVAIVQYCTKEGAQVDSRSLAGYTALHMAVFKQDIHMVKALLSAGAKLKSAADTGFPLLMELAKNDGYHAGKKTDDLVKLLINSGADPSQKNQYGNTALMYTINRKNFKLLNAFLKAGATTNTGDSNGNTLTHKLAYAALYTRLKNDELKAFILSLYNAGADFNAVNANGRTAVSIASDVNTGADLTGAEQFVRIFSDLSANMSIRDNNNKSPSQYAPGSSEIMKKAISANIQSPANLTRRELAEKGTPGYSKILSVAPAGNSGFFYVLDDNKNEFLISADMNGQVFQKKSIPGLRVIREAPGGKGIFATGVIQGEFMPGKPDKCKKDRNMVVFIAQMDMTMNEQWRKTFGVKGACDKTQVLGMSPLREGGVSLAVQFSSKQSIHVLDSSGEKISEFKVSGKLKNIHALPAEKESVILTNVGSPVFYTLAGKKVNFGRLKESSGAWVFSQISGGYAYATNTHEIKRKTGFSLVLADDQNKFKNTIIFASGDKDVPQAILPADLTSFYIIGNTKGSLHGNTYSGTGENDFFVMKLHQNGTRLYTRQIPIPVQIMDVISSNGTLFIAGNSTNGPLLIRVNSQGIVSY